MKLIVFPDLGPIWKTIADPSEKVPSSRFIPPQVVDVPIRSISVSKAVTSEFKEALSAVVEVSLEAATANSLILNSNV